MNKSLAAMNGALGSCSPLLLLFAAFRGNFLCPLRGSNSFLQMWGNLSAPGVAAHPCTKQGWEKWAYTESFYDFFFFFAILSVPQQVSACPLIQRSTLANSVAAYYGNFMCTIHDLMQACYVNRKRLFHCTVIESYRGDVKTCWAALLHRNTNIYQQQRDAATFLLFFCFCICKLDQSFMWTDNSSVWNEWAVWWTRVVEDKHFPGAFIFIYNHCAA